MSSEATGFLAVRVPDVECGTKHVAARVVHQVAAEVLVAEEDFDDWLDASAGRAPIYFGTFGKDDLDADPAPSATRRTTQLTPLDTTISGF